jgi:glycerol-1-phosphate dehydrogenase [NAD(P)+]
MFLAAGGALGRMGVMGLVGRESPTIPGWPPLTPLDVAAIGQQLASGPGGDALQPVGLGQLADGPGALGRLADLAGRIRLPRGPVVVLAARAPVRAAGQDIWNTVGPALGSHRPVRWCVVGSGARLRADKQTVAAATADVAGAACIVTIGAGTVTDVGKAAAHAAGRPAIPLICVQAATSTGGFASPFAALFRDGVWQAVPARWPDALIIDPDVLASAPGDLNRAGLGEVIATITATADWHLAAAFAAGPAAAGGPAWNATVAGLGRASIADLEVLSAYLGSAAGLSTLARVLALGGIAAGAAGSTAPVSGTEHAISHLLDAAAAARGEPAARHGAQVGVASLVAASAWAHVLQRIDAGMLDRPARVPDPDQARNVLEAAFAELDPTGAMAAQRYAGYARKVRLLCSPGDPLAELRAGWRRHREQLEPLLAGPAELARVLRAAGLPVTFAELGVPVSATTARWALASCALQRQRVGVADLAALLGAWQDDDIDEVLHRSGTVPSAG